ncbi:MAG: hypothetical protein HOH82_03130, partial [Planctomycetaceae bacterium]|nr:hypothetical protein [Planctomycetaceae bacterium]
MRVGLSGKLYRNTATYATPTWSEIKNVRDLTLNVEASEADASRRGGGGWREVLKALKDGGIEFELLHENGNADNTALRDAFFNDTNVDMLALDGDVATSGSEGLRMTVAVMNFSRSEPMEDSMTHSVVVK